MSEYVIRTVSFGDGEKMPMLVRKANMLGVFDAAIFALHLREAGLKTKTIDSAMRAIRLLYEVLHEKNISSSERVRQGELLNAAEITAVADRCKTQGCS